MVVLNFTLSPASASKIHDLLVCLGKFSDTVAIEARKDKVDHHIFAFLLLLFSYLYSALFHRSQPLQICICCNWPGQ